MGNDAEVPLFSKLFHSWTPMRLNDHGHRHSLFWEASEKPSTVYVLVMRAWINFSFLVLKYFKIAVDWYDFRCIFRRSPLWLRPDFWLHVRSPKRTGRWPVFFFFLGLSFAQKMSFVSVILSYSCRPLFLMNEVERAINEIWNSIQRTSAAPSSSPFPPHPSSSPPFLSTYWTFVLFQSQLHLALNLHSLLFPAIHPAVEGLLGKDLYWPSNKDLVSLYVL